MQLVGDFLVGEAFGDEFEHCLFPVADRFSQGFGAGGVGFDAEEIAEGILEFAVCELAVAFFHQFLQF